MNATWDASEMQQVGRAPCAGHRLRRVEILILDGLNRSIVKLPRIDTAVFWQFRNFAITIHRSVLLLQWGFKSSAASGAVPLPRFSVEGIVASWVLLDACVE